MIAVVATGSVEEPSPTAIARATVIESLAVAPVALDAEAGDNEIFVREDRLERGDTLAALLARLGVDPADAARLTTEHGKSKALRTLRPGMVVQAQTGEDGGLRSLRFISGRDSLLGFERDGERFVPIEKTAALTPQIAMRTGEIRSSLFPATDDADVPDAVAVQIAEIFGGDIDFTATCAAATPSP